MLFGERFDFLLFSVSFCQFCFLCLTVRLFWTVLNFFCRRILSGWNVQKCSGTFGGTGRLRTSGWLYGTHSRVPPCNSRGAFPDLLCMSFQAHGESHALSMVHQWWAQTLYCAGKRVPLLNWWTRRLSNWWRSQFTDQRQSARFSKIWHLCRISSTQSISSTGFELFELSEFFERKVRIAKRKRLLKSRTGNDFDLNCRKMLSAALHLRTTTHVPRSGRVN